MEKKWVITRPIIYFPHRPHCRHRRVIGDETRRRPDYIYTEKERAVLGRLRSCAKSFTEYAGYTVPELIAIAYACRFDLDEDGQEFVEKLHAWSATDLKRRQIKRLAGICRCFERVGRDTLDEAA